MLPTLRLVQIGDVHLPSAAEHPPFVDQKDVSFPIGLRTVISKSPLKTVFLRIFELLTSAKADAILFMGDLTDVGRIEGYRACARYISTALQVHRGGEFCDIPTGIVPGNHDIDRNLALQPGSETKFKPLLEALRDQGLPDIPIRDPLKILLSREGVEAQIFLMNSCWGCGERQFIPDDFRKPIAEAIDAALDNNPTALKAYYDRQLDTPAFSIDSISTLMEQVRQTSPSTLSIVAAHHNLLPQRIPRLASYTELINAGALRSSLMELERPIVYLHGHIHDDPIEIITAPNGAPLIVVSAPEASKGFNVIEVTFNRLGLPITTRIFPFRFDGSGVLKSGRAIKIPINNRRRISDGPRTGEVYRALLAKRECYWDDIVQIGKHQTPALNADDLVEVLELLSSDRSITISNDDLPPKHWIVKAEI